MDNLIVTTTATPTTTGASKTGSEQSNSDGLTDTERVIIIAMLSVLSVIGTIGNALAIYVFANLKQKVMGL